MCGVFGTITCSIDQHNNDFYDLNAAYDTYRALLSLQHRGQDAAGILSYSFGAKQFSMHKDLGLVNEVFNKKQLAKLVGKMAIGHNRYGTTGDQSSDNVQPLIAGFPIGIGLAHNGNIVNYHKMRELISQTHNRQLLTQNDLEIFLSFFAKTLMEKVRENHELSFEDLEQAAQNIFESIIGAYSIVGLLAGKGLFGLRDPNGIRPLILGRRVDGDKISYALSSETHSLEFLDFEIVRNIEPGEILFISETGDIFSNKNTTTQKRSTPCMFEWVYFSAVESTIESRPVYGVRRKLGERLADKLKPLMSSATIKPDIVCPVPDTSRCAAIALAESLGLSYREGLIKNRYTQRSFIQHGQENREKTVELKLNPVRSEIAGKNILLVDDSVVRGTTSKRIIKLLRKCGAKEITLAVSCPPINKGCFYGVDFPEEEQLIAYKRDLDEIRNEIGVDQIVYLDEEDLKIAIGQESLCQACINGEYPTCIKDAQEFAERRYRSHI